MNKDTKMPADMDYQLRNFLRSNEPLCHWCDEEATYIVDQDVTHGGGENGPAWDAPVLRFACDKCKENTSYMLPVPIA